MELEQQIWIPTQPAYEEVGPFTKLWTTVLPGARLLDQKIEGVMSIVLLSFFLLILFSPLIFAIYLLAMVITGILRFTVRRIK